MIKPVLKWAYRFHLWTLFIHHTITGTLQFSSTIMRGLYIWNCPVQQGPIRIYMSVCLSDSESVYLSVCLWSLGGTPNTAPACTYMWYVMVSDSKWWFNSFMHWSSSMRKKYCIFLYTTYSEMMVLNRNNETSKSILWHSYICPVSLLQ